MDEVKEYCEICKEEINKGAKKCKNCGSYLNKCRRCFAELSNSLALILSIIAIVGMIVNFTRSNKRIEKQVSFEYLDFSENILSVNFYNNSQNQLFLIERNAKFYITNLGSKKDTVINAQIEFLNNFADESHPVLSDSQILKMELRPRTGDKLIDENVSDSAQIRCELTFRLKYRSNRDIEEKMDFKLGQSTMNEILSSFHVFSGS